MLEGQVMSDALTTPALFFFREIHSIELSTLSTTNHFKFNIKSSTLSLIQGIVEYS